MPQSEEQGGLFQGTDVGNDNGTQCGNEATMGPGKKEDPQEQH